MAMEVKELVLEVMRKENKPVTAGQVAELANIERKLVDKAFKELKKDESIVSPKNCYWEPKVK